MIQDQKNKQAYKKVGNKYVPMADWEAPIGLFAYGDYLVHKDKNSTYYVRINFPEYAEVEAVLVRMKEKMVKAMLSAEKPYPAREFTPSQLRRWRKLMAETNSREVMAMYGSISDVVDAGLDVVRDAIRNKK